MKKPTKCMSSDVLSKAQGFPGYVTMLLGAAPLWLYLLSAGCCLKEVSSAGCVALLCCIFFSPAQACAGPADLLEFAVQLKAAVRLAWKAKRAESTMTTQEWDHARCQRLILHPGQKTGSGPGQGLQWLQPLERESLQRRPEKVLRLEAALAFLASNTA